MFFDEASLLHRPSLFVHKVNLLLSLAKFALSLFECLHLLPPVESSLLFELLIRFLLSRSLSLRSVNLLLDDFLFDLYCLIYLSLLSFNFRLGLVGNALGLSLAFLGQFILLGLHFNLLSLLDGQLNNALLKSGIHFTLDAHLFLLFQLLLH